MKWAISAITLIHGLIHLMGVVDGLGIKKMAGPSSGTTIVLSPAVKIALSYVWLLAFFAFMVTIFGLVADKSYWRVAAIFGIIISQILIIIWWKGARVGTVANIIILAAVLFYGPSIL